MPHPTVLAQPLAALAESLTEPGTAEGFFTEDLLSLARRHLKSFLEISLERELTADLGCGAHARSPQRRDYRNGYYTRDLATGLGLLQGLRIPRSRKGGFQPSLFQRYERRKREVEQFIQALFFAGVSTRGVAEVLELLWGYAPSASTVSAVVAQIDAEVKAFHQRAVGDDYLYLFLDGLTVTLKELPTAKKRLVLVAYGITTDGRRVLLDYHLAPSESSTEWERFLLRLQGRGLQGKHLRLITTDGGSGLRKALQLVYGEIPHQLCWVHKLRNVAQHLKKSQEAPCLAQAQELYRAQNRREVREAWKRWKARWEKEAPAAVACLAADLEALCTFLACPPEHHVLIRTTNYIERLIRELRRRTRPMGAFADRSSCDRLFYGVVRRVNRNWSRKTLPAFTHEA
jgi:putative transposase